MYRKLRARGATGWNNEDKDSYTEMYEFLAPALLTVADGISPRMLEIGCGAGNFSVMLAQHGYTVTGVDISPTAVDWAKERARSTNTEVVFRVDNVLTLSTCGDAMFDVVVDGHCLHCIIGDDRARCIESVRRVLKPGGLFIVLTMCGEVTNQQLLKTFDPITKVTIHDGRPNRYIGSADAIIAEVALAGFGIDSTQVTARKEADDMDNLVIRAAKPCDPLDNS